MWGMVASVEGGKEVEGFLVLLRCLEGGWKGEG